MPDTPFTMDAIKASDVKKIQSFDASVRFPRAMQYLMAQNFNERMIAAKRYGQKCVQLDLPRSHWITCGEIREEPSFWDLNSKYVQNELRGEVLDYLEYLGYDCRGGDLPYTLVYY